MTVSDVKRLDSLLLRVAPIIKVHVFWKFMSLLITFVAINNEETLKKDFASKYFFEVKTVAIRTKTPLKFISWTCHQLPMKVLKQKNPLHKFVTNAEAYLEPSQIYTMKLFCENSSRLNFFDKNLHHRFSPGFSIRLCNGRKCPEEKWFFKKILKVS